MFPNEVSADFSPAAGVQVKGIRGANGIYYGKISVEFSNGIEYSRDQGQSWQAYNTPVQFAPSKGYSVLYRTIGSSEYNTLNLTVKLDSIAPLTTAEMVSASNSDGYYKGSAQVKLSAIDQQSGVKTIQYSTDLGMNWVTYSSPVTLTEEQASQFYYRSIDYSGNIEKNRILTVLIDSTPPDVPTVRIDPMYWTTQNATVSIIDGTDENSGTAKTEYSIGESGQWITYENPFVVSTENETIYARSIDGAGNISPIVETFVPIDRTAPQSPKVEMDEEWSWLPVLISINTEQDQNERNRIRYQFKMGDSLEWETYVDELSIEKVGENPISFRSFDEAENYSPIVTKVARFDDIPPTAPTTFKVDNLRYNQFDLSWSGATDNIGIKEYDIYTEDDQFVATVDKDHYQITGLKANTTYRYKLVTYDLAYNESDYSEVFEVTTHSRPDFQSDGNSFIALRGDGSVWTWGTNNEGSLGNGSTNARSIPKKIANLTNVKSISVGVGFTLAQKIDGTVWGWGGSPVNSKVPKEIESLKGTKQFFIKEKAVFAIQKDNSLWGWGSGTMYGSYSKVFEDPAKLYIEDVKQVAMNPGYGGHVLVLTNSGTMWTWGFNSSTGQLGRYPSSNSYVPSQLKVNMAPDNHIELIKNVKKIAVGNSFNLILEEDGTMSTWGNDELGQLGNNRDNNFFEPQPKNSFSTSVKVLRTTTKQDAPLGTYRWLENITDIAAGTDYAVALDKSGNVWGWGNNNSGELSSSSEKIYYHAEKLNVENIKQVFARNSGRNWTNFTLALKNNNQLVGWGDSTSGVLGGEKKTKIPSSALLNDVDNLNSFATDITATKIDETFWMLGQATWNGTQYSLYHSPQQVRFGDEIVSGDPGSPLPINNEIPSQPKELKVVKLGSDKAELTWNSSTSSSQIKEYTIYVDQQKVDTSVTTMYTLKGLKPSQNYTVTIEAIDDKGFISELSEDLKFQTMEDIPSQPIDLKIIKSTYHTVQLSWSSSESVSSVKEYYVYQNGTKIGTTTNPYYNVTGLKSGESYQYSISAINQLGNISRLSEPLNVILEKDIPSTPLNLKSDYQNATMIKVNWSASLSQSVIEKYIIYVNDKEFGQTQDISYSIENLQASTNYKISIASVTKEGFMSSISNPISITTQSLSLPSTPVNLKVTDTGSFNATLNWDTLDKESIDQSYNIYVNDKYYKNISTKNIVLDQLNLGDSYKVYIKSVNSNGYESSASNVITFSTANKNVSNDSVVAFSSYMALMKNNYLWMWGKNDKNQLGDKTVVNKNMAISIEIGNVKQVKSGSNYTLAVKSDGTLWGWGTADKGLGDLGTSSNAPRLITRINNVKDVATSLDSNYVLKNDGTIWVFGKLSPYSARQINNIASAIQITGGSGSGHVNALKKDGTVWMVTNSGATQILGLEGMIQVTIEGATGYGLKKDGTVWKWWMNSNSQVSDINSIAGLNKITQISNRIALKADGTVWTWGDGSYGQLGNGSTNSLNEPAPIAGLENVISVSSGTSTRAIIKKDGTVWTWGDNSSGQLGNATTSTISSSPVKIVFKN